MIFYWCPHCETCEIDGPRIRRASGTTKFIDEARATTSLQDALTSDPAVFGDWLDEHEYHKVVLLAYGKRPGGPRDVE